MIGTDSDIGTRIKDILDGTPTTVMLVEVPDELAVPWTKPDDYTYEPQYPMGKLIGLHEGGFLALLCDGSVHFLKSSLSPDILLRLFQKNDKQVVPPEALQ